MPVADNEARRQLQALRAIAERVAAGEGLEVVDVEFLGAGGQRLLRVYLDKAGGIQHRDCELVSRQLSAILDAEEVIPGETRYTLEVSSPGLDRRLVKREDFERFAGQRVRLQLRPGAGAPRRRFSGQLEGMVENRIRLRLSGSDETVEIERDDVARANLVPRW